MAERKLKKLMITVTFIALLTLPILGVVVKAQEERYFFELNTLVLKGDVLGARVAPILVDEFKKIGIKLTYDVVDGSVWNERGFKTGKDKSTYKDGGFDLHMSRWGRGALDPEQLALSFHSEARILSAFSWWQYTNADLDKQFDKARVTLDREERYKIYSKAQEILVDDLPNIPIVAEKIPQIVRANVVGYNPLITTNWRSEAKYWSLKDKKGGTLRFAYTQEPVKLLPWWGNIGAEAFSHDVWEPLITWDEKRSPVGVLAKSWEISKDGLTYTFQLERNVLWHDGTPFTAQDVVFTFNALLNPETGTTLYGAMVTNIASVRALDDYTVEFKMKTANPANIIRFYPDAVIVPKHILEKVPLKDWRTHDITNKKPIGTGPFEFVEYVPQQYLKMKAFDKYYKGRPTLDERISISIPESATAQAAIKKGDVDILSARYSFDAKQLKEMMQDPNLKVNLVYQEISYMFGVNTAHPILSNKNVRKAISSAIPRETIAKDILEDMAIPLTSLVWDLHWYWNSTVRIPKYDTAQAKRFMEMAGYNLKLLEPPPVTPISEQVLYAVVGLVVGLVAGVATRWYKR